MFDEAINGDISNDPNSPSVLDLVEGTNTLSATTGGGLEDQEYITVTVPDGFELAAINLSSFSSGGDAAFIGVQAGTTFTEPLNDSADRGNFLGYALFNGTQVNTDILDNVGNGSGAIGFTGALPSGTYTFAIQQLTPTGSSYELDFNVAAVTVDPPPTGEPPVVSFEVVPNTFSEEDPNNLVEWKWTVAGDFPEGGITVNMTTMGGGAPFAFTEQFAASPEAEFVNADIVGFDGETGDLNILLEAPEASFSLFFANDILEEGTQEFEFFVVDGDGYTVDAEMSGGTFTITDDNGGPGIGPTIGLSVSETNLAEGDPVTVTFTAEGTIPAEGVQVLVQSDVFGALGQFDLNGENIGSTLSLTGISGVPEVGDAGGGSFLVTIVEPTATITLNVFDDIIAEAPQDITFTLANGELYEVAPDAASTTLTISDEVQEPGPTVGLSVDRTDLVEGGDPVTLTISVTGDIPAEGLPVLINDVVSAGNQTRSLTEFDVSSFTTTGISGFPSPAEGDSGFFVTVTEPTATITLAAFDDGADEDEATEQFNFAVIDGEAYEVDPAASSITVSIADPVAPPVGNPPVVSFVTTTPLVTEDEQPAATFVFTIDGDIPDDGQGVVVTVGGDGIEKLFAPRLLDGSVPLAFEPADGVIPLGFTGTEVILGFTAPEVTATATIFDDIVEEVADVLNFEILPGDGYTIGGDSMASVTIEDGASANPGGGPIVSLSVSDTDLEEGDELTVNFDVEGDIPEEGLELFIDGGPTDLGEFNIFGDNGIDPATDLVGLAGFPEQGDDFGGFFVTVVEPQASITLSVFEDGPGEGEEILNFELANGEQYEVNPDASNVALTINDTPETTSIVSITTTTPVVTEDENPVLNLTFTVDGPIPEGGVPITLAGDFTDLFAPGVLDGNVPPVTIPEDGFIPIANRDPEFDINLTAPVFTIDLQIFDDLIEEEPFTIDTEIIARGEDVVIRPDASVASVTIEDGASVIPGSGPTVSLSVSDTDLVEGDELTVFFDTEGEIPDGGLELFITGTPTALGEFDIFGENGIDPATDLVGLAGFPVQGGDDGGFFVTLVENQASITLSVFDDGPTEGTELLPFELVNGEAYEVAPDANAVELTINDGGEDASFAVESGVTSVFLDFALLEEAAGLTLVSADSDATPADRPVFLEPFQVGFAITEETDFSFEAVPFTPLGGSIEHSGTITVGLGGAEATIGEFSIGFDPSRVSDTASGFFVADTLDDPLGLEVLFDLSAPGAAFVSNNELEISDADLLLSPELAGALGLADLAGTDVGDAQVDAVVAEVPTPTDSIEVLVTVESLSPVDGNFLTPVWVGFHNGEFDLYNRGEAATPGLESLAEDGSTALLSEEFVNSGFGAVDGVVLGPVGLEGPIDPGEIATATFTLDPNADNSQFFSYASMIIPSNDAFIANGDPLVHSLFDADGNFVGAEFIVAGGEVLDAGTEVNDELVENTAFFSQAEANTGVDENGTVELHPGFIPGGRILSEDGTTEGAPAAFTGADFTADGYQVVRITVEEVTSVPPIVVEPIEGTDGDDRLRGTEGNDVIVALDGNDRLFADGGSDILDGGDGRDRLFGGDDRDILIGNMGDDFLNGGAGDDVLMGVTGRDVLVGGEGADLFVYGVGDGGARNQNEQGNDLIRDFEVGIDKIGLVDGELTFADITITQSGSRTLLGVASTGEVLAALKGVDASSIGESSFEIVPNVATVEDALTIL